MNEYQQVVKRFGSNQQIAPLALLRTVGIQLRIGNVDGARKDLQDLIDQYPHFRADETWLKLGNVTYEAGMVESAMRVYRELYEDNLSIDSRAAASFGVGQCAFDLGDYRSATHWLKRYLGLHHEADVDEYKPKALLLLGKSHSRMDEIKPAITYLYRALAEPDGPGHELDALLEIGDAEYRRDNHLRALGALNRMEKIEMPPEVNCRRSIAISRNFRAMDLPERAIDTMLLSLQLKTLQAEPFASALELEYARALRDNGDTHAAVEAYLKVWPKLKPEAETWRAACEIARLCLDTDRVGQAISILEETLKVVGDGDIQARAKNLLVRAYLLQEEFEKASQTAAAGGAIR
jgi:tetratricopeptide (TPR) repeat protein